MESEVNVVSHLQCDQTGQQKTGQLASHSSGLYEQKEKLDASME